jgi:pimeloyl-ACP methyl ester carboxylesterase
MPEYESLVWPLGMMFNFVDVQKVLNNIVGWKDASQERVLIIAGEKDTLMSVDLMRRMAADYSQHFVAFAKRPQKIQVENIDSDEMKLMCGDQKGVGFEVINGSGHHIQNDLHWEECARKILAFLQQL